MKCFTYVLAVAVPFALGCGVLALRLTHDAVLSAVVAILACALAATALITAALRVAQQLYLDHERVRAARNKAREKRAWGAGYEAGRASGGGWV